MQGRLVLRNCSLSRADGRVQRDLSVVVQNRKIATVGPDVEVSVLPGDWEVRCAGRLVLPGLIDCHTRLVNAALTPWTGAFLMKTYQDRTLHEWRVAESLTAGEVEAIAAYSMARGLKQGVTMFVEHLTAPSDVEGALHAEASAATHLGARLVNSHATQSVSSEDPATVAGAAQVESNARYAEHYRNHHLVRASIGFHSSGAVDDDVLRAAGSAKERLAIGAHFRLAENGDDLAATWRRSNSRVVSRIDRFGLLGGGSIGARALAIDRSEAARLADSRTLVALSPRSGLVVEGGSAFGSEGALIDQNLVGLGSSGRGSLAEEFAAGFADLMSLSRAGRLIDPDGLLAAFLVSGPAELCTMIFGDRSGSIEPGALADLLVLDFIPPCVGDEYLPPPYARLGQMPVAWTIVDGRVVVREGALVGANMTELCREAALATESVWKRLKMGVPS